MDHDSFRDPARVQHRLALSRSRDLLRRLLKEHTPDDARQQVAERVIEHLEQSSFELDDGGQALRRKPLAPLHRTPGE